MEDTEWTDILRKHGIIGDKPKDEPKEETEEIISSFDKKLKEIQSEDDLNDLEESDEHFIREYRNRRIAEIRAKALIPRFGDLREITATDYVQEVNNAGNDIWVVLLLYESGIPECSLLLRIISELATKHQNTKFLKSIASLCVPNFPDSSLPAIFVYKSGLLIKQLIGNKIFGGIDMSLKSVERILCQLGALTIESTDESKSDKKCNKFYEEYDD